MCVTLFLDIVRVHFHCEIHWNRGLCSRSSWFSGARKDKAKLYYFLFFQSNSCPISLAIVIDLNYENVKKVARRLIDLHRCLSAYRCSAVSSRGGSGPPVCLQGWTLGETQEGWGSSIDMHILIYIHIYWLYI